MTETIRLISFTSLGFNTPSSGHDEGAGEVCIANIGPRERQKRLRIGLALFLITLIVLGVLIAFDVNPVWRLLLLFMFWGAGTSYFEARDKTCVALVLTGSRKMDDVAEKIEDVAELKQVRRQSRKLIIKAFFTALALTLIAFILP